MASYLPADCWLAIPLGCVFTAKGISSTRRAAAMPQQVFVDDGAMNCFSKWLAACPPVKFSVAVESTNVQSISGQLKLLHAPGSDTYRLVGRDKKTVSTWASYFEWKNWGKLDGYPKTLLRRLVNIMGSYQFQLSASTCSRGLARSCAAKVSRISGAAAADLLHKISLPHASASCCRAFTCTAGSRKRSKTASPRKEALWRYIRYLHLLNQLPATPNFLLRKKKVSCGASMCFTHFRPVKTSTNPHQNFLWDPQKEQSRHTCHPCKEAGSAMIWQATAPRRLCLAGVWVKGQRQSGQTSRVEERTSESIQELHSSLAATDGAEKFFTNATCHMYSRMWEARANSGDLKSQNIPEGLIIWFSRV